MSRYIDIQDAVNLLMKKLDNDYLDGYSYLEELKELPTADVKPVVRGEWIPGGDFPVRCSNCGRGSVQPENFCMTCGADMRGGNDGN